MRLNNFRVTIFTVIFSILLFLSCTSKKKSVYFQGNASAGADANKNYTPVFHCDDLLSITVMGLDPDAVRPFNMPVTNVSNNQGGYASGNPSPPGYLIDKEGMVDFPVIGKIQLAGLDRMQAVEMLKGKLKEYINNPTINIRILNYKVTVLGEVKNPGTFTIPNERITLLEAIGIAGDLQITGVRKNVLVVRDDNGKKTETRIDLTSKDVFASPVYYLHQNDVVYVEPNRAKINSSVLNTANVGIVISIISLMTTMIVLLARH